MLEFHPQSPTHVLWRRNTYTLSWYQTAVPQCDSEGFSENTAERKRPIEAWLKAFPWGSDLVSATWLCSFHLQKKRRKDHSGRRLWGERYHQECSSRKGEPACCSESIPEGFSSPTGKWSKVQETKLSVVMWSGFQSTRRINMVFISSPFPAHNVRSAIKTKKWNSTRTERKGEGRIVRKKGYQSSRRWKLNMQVLTDLLEQRKLKLSKSEAKKRQAVCTVGPSKG